MVGSLVRVYFKEVGVVFFILGLINWRFFVVIILVLLRVIFRFVVVLIGGLFI